MRLPLQELLSQVYRAFADEFHTAMAAAGFDDLTLAQGTNVLRFIGEEGLRVGVIAELAGLSKQAVSQQVAYLEAHGYVSVAPDPADGRGKVVCNTERGWACRAVARPLFAEIERQWRRRLGAEEVKALRRSLEVVAARVAAVEE
jgi:DNA-binding MarR family transcriptional regulator